MEGVWKDLGVVADLRLGACHYTKCLGRMEEGNTYVIILCWGCCKIHHLVDTSPYRTGEYTVPLCCRIIHPHLFLLKVKLHGGLLEAKCI